MKTGNSGHTNPVEAGCLHGGRLRESSWPRKKKGRTVKKNMENQDFEGKGLALLWTAGPDCTSYVFVGNQGSCDWKSTEKRGQTVKNLSRRMRHCRRARTGSFKEGRKVGPRGGRTKKRRRTVGLGAPSVGNYLQVPVCGGGISAQGEGQGKTKWGR